MHWLSWHELGEFLRTWQGAATAFVAALATIYYGPRKMLETYDWYMYRFRDHKVRRFLRSSVIPSRLTALGEEGAKAVPKLPREIGEAIGMPEKRVLGSLKRLERTHQVISDGEKWKIAL